MDIYQIIITYYPIWSPFEWIIFLSVLALAVCIAVVLYKKQKITMRQSIAGILLLLYLLLYLVLLCLQECRASANTSWRCSGHGRRSCIILSSMEWSQAPGFCGRIC